MVKSIAGTLSDTERDAFLEGVNRLEATLSSIGLVTLSLSEVSRLSKAGPASASFVTEGLELASRNPGLLTADTDPAEVKEKLRLIRNLDAVNSALGALGEKLAHTAIVAKSEAYEIARTAYLLSKRKKKSGIVESHNKLAQRFKGQGKRKNAKDTGNPLGE